MTPYKDILIAHFLGSSVWLWIDTINEGGINEVTKQLTLGMIPAMQVAGNDRNVFVDYDEFAAKFTNKQALPPHFNIVFLWKESPAPELAVVALDPDRRPEIHPSTTITE